MKVFSLEAVFDTLRTLRQVMVMMLSVIMSVSMWKILWLICITGLRKVQKGKANLKNTLNSAIKTIKIY